MKASALCHRRPSQRRLASACREDVHVRVCVCVCTCISSRQDGDGGGGVEVRGDVGELICKESRASGNEFFGAFSAETLSSRHSTPRLALYELHSCRNQILPPVARPAILNPITINNGALWGRP